MELYNTLTRQKQTFEPRIPGKVSMYVCGITAYDYCHIGHARSTVVFDVLARFLKRKGFELTFIRNFTDIDDKIIKRANEMGLTSTEVAEKNIQYFYEDMDRLNILRPNIEPRCTEHIPEMLTLTQDLIDKGHAYATASGDVYFRVRSFDGYGKLSRRDIDEMRSGARIEPGEEKEDPLDFALWKAAKPGEPSWESPWGQGRPGWHLECSAMSEKYVALPLDIHGGGQDLAFPHHENEIAQSEASTGKELARFWVHNGFIQINSEKMSKSLGNFFTIRDVLDKFQPETMRFFLMSSHYRSPLDFSDEALEEAEKGIRRVYAAIGQMREFLQKAKWSKAQLPEDIGSELKSLEEKWDAAMEDDLNTAAALGYVFSAVRLAGRVAEDKAMRKSEGARDLWQRILDDLAGWDEVLGVFHRDPDQFLAELRDTRASRKGIDIAAVQAKLDERLEARKNKDFARSDALRDELAALGADVKDTPAGQVWDVL
jgi:cysteinyl-tRNA synthetase